MCVYTYMCIYVFIYIYIYIYIKIVVVIGKYCAMNGYKLYLNLQFVSCIYRVQIFVVII